MTWVVDEDAFFAAIDARALELARMRRAGERGSDAYRALWSEALEDELAIYESESTARESRAGRVAAAERMLGGEGEVERLDAYVLRRWGLTDPDVVQVRDYFDTAAEAFTGRRWYVRVLDGQGWPVRVGDLEDGERPEMIDGYCHITRSV